MERLKLDAHQHDVMTRVLAEEESRREHAVVYLSGAHAYGFPSPDSDLDLKAIHVARTTDLLGFTPPTPTVDRAEIIETVEIDYTSNELAHALSGILGGNGNFIERVLGRTVAHASPLLDELRPLVQRSLNRQVHRHYRGFAQNQLRALEREPTAKKLLLRASHHVDRDSPARDVRARDRPHVHHAKVRPPGGRHPRRTQARRRAQLRSTPPVLEAWRSRVDALFVRLDQARDRSVLPEEAPNEPEVRAWLLDVRRARFDR